MTVFGNGSTTEPKSSASGAYGAPRPGGRRHAGRDYIGYRDLKNIATGVVTFVGELNSTAGLTVAIDLPFTLEGCTITIVRMHMARIQVAKGQKVPAGAQIGIMGHTGNAEGDCDHVEIRYWKNGKLVKTEDPHVWINNMIAAERPKPKPPAPAGNPIPSRSTRRVKAPGSNGREGAALKYKVVQFLKAGTVATFDGYHHGQSINGNDVWFRGAFNHNWFWSGNFTSQSTAGLPRV